MLEWQQQAADRVNTYSSLNLRYLNPELRFGWGYDGIVLGTTMGSAIKGFGFEQLYQRERDVYLRLAEFNVDEILGFTVPRL